MKTRQTSFWFLILITIFTLQGQMSAQVRPIAVGVAAQPVNTQMRSVAVANPNAPLTTQDDYALTSSDVVEVTVFQEEDLAAKTRVTQKGCINLPLIGVVDVAGKSVEEAARIIEARYRDGYLVSPQVNVTVTEFSSHRFTILGQVVMPGAYLFPANTRVDLLQAVGMAGGYTKSADQSRVAVRRSEDGVEKVYKLNAKDMAKKGGSASFEVLPNDVITIGESFF